MIQTATYNHELFSADDTLEVTPRLYQGDQGSMEVVVHFTQGGAPADLTGWAVSVTNRAPNGDMVMQIGGEEAPLLVSGDAVTWTLGPFDTQQVGTYKAQLRVATDQQTITVVFIKYNVEKSVHGNKVTVPVQYTTLSALVSEIQGMREDVAEMEQMVAEMRELYDLFMTIIVEGGVSWDTLIGKPETFPPSAHTHAEFETFRKGIAQLTDNQENMMVEIVNEWVVIPSGDWTYNELKMRYEATIVHEKIAADTDVEFQVSDEDSGTFNLTGLFPQAGSVTLYTNSLLTRDITLLLKVVKCFTNETEATA